MEVITERVRHWLGFIVVVQAGEIAPAGIAAKLDQSCAKHDAEEQPPEQPDGDCLGNETGPAQEDREKTGFEKNGFPAETVECLADVYERQIDEVHASQ